MKVAILGTGSVGKTFVQALAPQLDTIFWGTSDPAQSALRPIEETSATTVSAWLGAYPNVRLLAYGDCQSADLFINVSKGESAVMMDVSGPTIPSLRQ